MRLMSVDQSLSHCAVVIWDGNKPSTKYMIRTGSTSSKGKRQADVVYFDHVIQQIEYIVGRICEYVKTHEIDTYVMESLSLGSLGSATRDLAGLFYCIQMALIEHHLNVEDLHVVAPTSVKSFARTLLPEEEQTFQKEKVDKKSGKSVYSLAKTVMKKPEMVRATEVAEPGFLSGLTLAAGKADYADAYLIGRAFQTRQGV
ncbi:hypothetical protein Hena1_00610 [Erwinia phage Hena1]|uniref:Uncharacterized protein n=1 Tax=Erwinia phage Hena1 TaxID=2678601 RepID=A0A6B9JI70_9CAUD|nr:hypothetical protein HWC84_gp060 [Erwinia phage Hena1]QGZ16237.1 hypothetical protein Hena1_00610 [Erwinia phage Hena1]